MLLKFNEFTKANETLDTIINDTETDAIRAVLESSIEEIEENQKAAYLNHLNSLFLNILLNRIDDLGETAREKSLEARSIISTLINV